MKTTYRSDDNVIRISYRPEWSESKPWASYKNGDAVQHFSRIDQAIGYFEKEGYSFKSTKEG